MLNDHRPATPIDLTKFPRWEVVPHEPGVMIPLSVASFLINTMLRVDVCETCGPCPGEETLCNYCDAVEALSYSALVAIEADLADTDQGAVVSHALSSARQAQQSSDADDVATRKPPGGDCE